MCIPVSLMATPEQTGSADASASHRAAAGADRQGNPGAGLPMSFESNQGQFTDDIQFRSRGAGYSVVLRSTEATLMLGGVQVPKRAEALRAQKRAASRGHRREPPVQPSESAVITLSLMDANPNAEVAGEAKSEGTANYFIGNDPALWRTAVPVFGKVRYHGVYPGVDLLYYGNQRQLEYDFVVAPGANPDRIRIRLEGVDQLTVDPSGDLIAHIGARHVRWQKARAYQTEGHNERTIKTDYIVESANQFAFRVGPYDSARPLIIDPLLIYSSYLGGSDFDSVTGTAVDSAGNVYLAGTTYSTNFPVFKAYRTNGPSSTTNSLVFLTKLNSNGTALVYSTYFGGTAENGANGLAVDTNGNAYVVGLTYSVNFPTRNPAQASKGNFNDAFLTKFGPFGTNLLYSTYYGDPGNPSSSGFGEEAFGVAVNNTGGAYIVGLTESGKAFNSKNPLQSGFGGGANDVMIARFDTTLSGSSSLIWGTWYGGSFDEYGYAIALDSAGNVYVTGYLQMLYCDSGDPNYIPCPPDFPTVNAFQPTFGGDPLEASADAFILKINNASSPSVVYATYFGGSDDDFGYGIAVDSSNNVYVVGETSSTDFPVRNAIQSDQTDSGFFSDGFVSKLNSSGTSLLYSTYLGGTSFDGARSIVLDRFGNATVVGYTFSTDFPVTPGAPQPQRGGGAPNFNRDLFVAKLNPAVPGPSSLVFGTYLGGSGDEAITAGGYYADHPGMGLALDTNLDIYVGSDTGSTNFPITAGSFQTVSGSALGVGDGIVTKISAPTDISVAVTGSTALATVGSNVLFTLYANNNGLTTFSNVAVVDALPAAFQYVSATGNLGTVSNNAGTVTWSIGAMTNGAAGTATITVTALQSGQVTNIASISAAPTDANTNNNVSRTVTAIRGVTDLRLSLTGTPDPVTFSSNVSYTITLTNAGPSPATSIVVSNPIPSGATYVLAFGGRTHFTYSNIVTWLVSDLPSGGSTNLTLVLQATAVGTLNNQAVVSLYELDPVLANNSATSQTTVNQLADLSIRSMSAAPQPVLATSNLTYTVVVTNPGPTAANSVQLADVLPAGFTFVSANASGGSTQFQGLVTCYLGNMAIGATATATITAKPPLDGLATNSATVSFSAADPNSANNTASVVSTVSPLANLAIGMTVSPSTVVATSNLVYSITVTNLGPTASYGVVVTDSLPAGLVFVSSQSSQGSCTQTGSVINCNLGILSNSSTATVTITATPMVDGQIVNTASVSASSADPVAGNNSASAPATVTQMADLSFASMTSAPATVYASSNITYTLIVTNPGPTTAGAVQVVDTLPPGFTFVSATPGGSSTQFQGVVTITLGSILSGQTKTSTITAKPPLDGLVTNSATISTSATDPSPGNNTSTLVSTISPLANLAVSMAVSPPAVVPTSNFVYTITVTNLGPTPASGVVVTDVLPANLVFVSAQSSQGAFSQTGAVVSCDLGSVTNFGSATVTIIAMTTTSGQVTNTASVSAATTDPVPGNNSASATASVGQLADVSVASITVAPDPVLATSNLTYTIIVSNAGPTAGNSVQVVDALPAGLTFVSATAPNGSTQFQGVVTCSLGNLPVGSTRTSTITAKTSLDGLVTNLVTASTSAADPLPDNNSNAVVSTVSQLANLAIGNRISPTTAAVSNNVIYTLSVTNLGPTAASNVVVTDVLPASLVFVSAQSSLGACDQAGGTVTCNLGPLTNNGQATITITATPTIEGVFSNTASVASAATDLVSGNNTSTAVLTVANNLASPTLRIALGGTNVVLYWGTNFTGFALQSNPGVASSNLWQTLTNTPLAIGDQYFVTNAVSPTPSFYRLVKVPPPPPLVLTAVNSGTNVIISWTTNSAGYYLQLNDTLIQPNNWLTLSNVNTIQNDRFIYVEPATNVNRFYRLVRFQ